MTPDRLWAKSWSSQEHSTPPRSAHYAEHLKDVLAAADRVLHSTGDDQIAALGLPIEQYRDRFRRIVRLAAAVHDLGKANDHFQGMVRGDRPRDNPQGFRHEWVTLLMLQDLREWLLPAVGSNELDIAITQWAVAGHHPAHHHESPPKNCPAGAGPEITLHLDHPDFHAALAWLRMALGSDLGAAPIATQPRIVPLVGEGNAFANLCSWSRAQSKTWDKLRGTPERRLVAAVKNCLIAADIAGSALPKQSSDDAVLWNWIDESFDSRPTRKDFESVVQFRLNGREPREFQKQAAASRSRVTFIKAGCGAGKTLVPYMWARDNYPDRRLYFCYPTTGTATEGFKDYLYSPEFDVKAKLFHSRSHVDHEIILTGRDLPNAEIDAAIRIESLESWSTPIVACTADTVLGLVQNNKRGLLCWPALAQSAFVFDEIHAFDDRMFGALLRFLRDLPGLPVLLMTASLPQAREEALRRVLEELMAPEFRQSLVVIPGPQELEELPRYHQLSVKEDQVLAEVAKTVRQGGKVLWVCNTVQRVMDAADRAEQAGLQPLLYHSRYRYEDRVHRHKAVVEAFHGNGPALAICSQVAEMSLDLSTDLLVTDLATVPALIQRLGRLNRKAHSGVPPKPFIVIEPENHLPYSPADLVSARVWLDRLPKENVSQRHLADCWEQVGDRVPDLIESAWLDGGPQTSVCELREASPGITILREVDRSLIDRPSDTGRYTIPMPPPPRSIPWKDWPRQRCIPICPSEFLEYDEMRGASWLRK